MPSELTPVMVLLLVVMATQASAERLPAGVHRADSARSDCIGSIGAGCPTPRVRRGGHCPWSTLRCAPSLPAPGYSGT